MIRPVVSRAWRYSWAGPNTAFGLICALMAVHRGSARVVDGVLEAHGPLLLWALRRLVPLPGGAAAMTFGHVVIGESAAALDDVRAHERIHVRQYELWGPLFVPAYLAASAWMLFSGRDAYYDNRFERAAYREDAARQAMGAGCDPR